MKARVKATGEVIELSDLEYDVYGNDYLRTELEITDDPDYWQKLKHQYAGMAMQGILSNNELLNTTLRGVYPPDKPQHLANVVNNYATTLVNSLKEESQCEK